MTSRITPARRNFWKRYQPTSCRDALEKCKEHAREARNLSIERIAEQMGLPDHWALYKWVESGRFPFVLIPAFETACGINLPSRWLAASGRHLPVDMPVGKPAEEQDLVQLGTGFQQAVQLLSDFYKSNGAADAQPVLEALRAHLESVAHHQFNVSVFVQPELDFS
ncbi:hypothetical protein [Ottowia sp.]|uniref:hypothetical protein n=1 Tax=Ottowia sp. TaxID=1898956 RepID=UPI003A8899FA